MGFRQMINEKPALGWAVAAVLAVVAIVLFFKTWFAGGDQPSVAELKSDVTIRCIETGDTWTMNRGQLERELYQRAYNGTLDLERGLINPNTGKPTGYPVASGGWTDMVERVKTEVEQAKAEQNR